MAREFGIEYPERPDMATLSDLLGIPHFTTSKGATVRKDFMIAVATALGVASAQLMAKDDLIRATWEAANRAPMPSDRLSPGGTVTNRVLREIHDGVLRNGVEGRVGPAAPTPPEADTPLPDEVVEDFDPSTLADERDRRLAEIAQREGQDKFRRAIFEAYGNRCAVTESDDVMTLQAAHIAPYQGPASNVTANGLCLRADIHILFDRGAIAFHESTREILVKPHLRVGTYKDVLIGHSLRFPAAMRDRPSIAALRAHRLWAGFLD